MLRSLLLAAAAAGASAAVTLSPWPLEAQVAQSMADAASIPLAAPTGLKRADYLKTAEGVVLYMRQFQDATGHIIDPYRGIETQYATPCFSFAAAAVAVNLGDPTGTLLNASALALDAAIQELLTKTCADGHCNFFTKPVMFAYALLKDKFPTDRVAQWQAGLQAMDPSTDYINLAENWGLVATVGDFFRTQAGFGNSSWWQGELDYQLNNGSPTLYTGNGLYQDHSGMDGLNPLPYDTFPTSGYVTVLMNAPPALGYTSYVGPYSALMGNITERAVWTHALMQSSWGNIPTGGRSSQHTWNEAVSAMAYEVFANKYKAAGDMGRACILQRAAHLSLRALQPWVNPTGEFQIVKNHFNASLRWGYEGYSFLTQYNLLPASMLAAAYYYSDPADSIPECTAFADAGGYVFELPEHKLIIAAAGGTYVEIETGSDPHYDSTGMHRVHINTCGTQAAGACTAVYPLLTPTAGPPQENGGIAIGAWWRLAGDEPASMRSLANMTYADVPAAVLTSSLGNSPAAVSFTVQYIILSQGTLVTETYNVTAAGVGMSTSISIPGVEALVELAARAGKAIPQAAVEAALAAGAPPTAADSPTITNFGLALPVFQYDGATNSTVDVDTVGNSVTVSMPGQPGKEGAVVYALPPPAAGHNYTWTYDPSPAAQVVTRNGMMSKAAVEVTVKTQTPSIAVMVSGKSS